MRQWSHLLCSGLWSVLGPSGHTGEVKRSHHGAVVDGALRSISWTGNLLHHRVLYIQSYRPALSAIPADTRRLPNSSIIRRRYYIQRASYVDTAAVAIVSCCVFYCGAMFHRLMT